MPEFEIQPLENEHLDPAAALLAARHARHREAEPLLPEIDDFRGQVEKELAEENADGVVALRDGELVAYFVGRLEQDPLLAERRGYAGFAGCAASDPEALRDLYAALAARWVAAGCVRHAVAIPATDEALIDPWLRTAFGVQFVWAARETARLKPVDAEVEIRDGTPDDLDAAARFDRMLMEHQTASPSFSGLELAPIQTFREDWSDTWDEGGGYRHFVAERDGRIVGHALLYERPGGDLRVPKQSIDLAHCVTVPEARRSGVAMALLGHVINWSHEHGYRSMTTDWRSVNLLSSRYWPARGFRPQFFRLYRRVP